MIQHLVTAAEVTIGAIGGALLNILLAQGVPADPGEWANMGASVVLGGLAVYLATRTIPALQKEHREMVADLTRQFREEIKAEREAHRSDLDSLKDK